MTTPPPPPPVVLSGLPTPQPFHLDVISTSTYVLWEAWRDTLETYFLAAAITDTKRKKALLLYLAGDEMRKVYRTLQDTEDTYDSTKNLLEAFSGQNKTLPSKGTDFILLFKGQMKILPISSQNVSVNLMNIQNTMQL